MPLPVRSPIPRSRRYRTVWSFLRWLADCRSRYLFQLREQRPLQARTLRTWFALAQHDAFYPCGEVVTLSKVGV